MTSVLLGGAVGDALGVFAESKDENYPPLLAWDGKSYIGSEHHNLKPTQFSDDTMFSLCVAESLIKNGFDPEDLAKRYVEMFDNNTIRGYGKSTLVAINNLRAGKHYTESGCVGSLGNGGAMRAAPLGYYFKNDLSYLIKAIKIDSYITHNSIDAEAASLSIALAAYFIANDDADDLVNRICEHLPDSDFKNKMAVVMPMVNSKFSPADVYKFIGTRCNVLQSVPAVFYTYFKCKTYEEAVTTVIRAGGDTDTNASMVGALMGIRDGIDGIPTNWSDEVEDRNRIMLLDAQLVNGNCEIYFK